MRGRRQDSSTLPVMDATELIGSCTAVLTRKPTRKLTLPSNTFSMKPQSRLALSLYHVKCEAILPYEQRHEFVVAPTAVANREIVVALAHQDTACRIYRRIALVEQDMTTPRYVRHLKGLAEAGGQHPLAGVDRKSTRLNSSHSQ